VAAQNMPAAEIDIDDGLVRRLLADQHPDLAGLPLALVANGWDNAIFRLGDDLAVRLPRRQLGADLVVNEQRWLPELAPRLPLRVPVPLRVGSPSGD
jgi:aminoglycoside phosphotransferase (APT) family kinase protein